MLRDGQSKVHLQTREAHPLDSIFMFPYLTLTQQQNHEPTQKEIDTFYNNSTFGGKDLMPDIVTEWTGHILISGPTKSGKTYLAAKLIHESDKPVFLISDIKGDDPSLKWLQRNGRLTRLTSIPTITDIANSYVLFDDVTDPDWLHFRDILYEQGRHHKITCISIIHNILSGIRNQAILNESEWICLFPRSNKAKIVDLMERKYRLRHKFRTAIINQAAEDGRYLFIHQHAPTFFMSSKFIVPF